MVSLSIIAHVLDAMHVLLRVNLNMMSQLESIVRMLSTSKLGHTLIHHVNSAFIVATIVRIHPVPLFVQQRHYSPVMMAL
jgi:hypothetical protein